METEGTHAPTKTYESSAYTWQGNMKAAQVCGEGVWKLVHNHQSYFWTALVKESWTFRYYIFLKKSQFTRRCDVIVCMRVFVVLYIKCMFWEASFVIWCAVRWKSYSRKLWDIQYMMSAGHVPVELYIHVGHHMHEGFRPTCTCRCHCTATGH